MRIEHVTYTRSSLLHAPSGTLSYLKGTNTILIGQPYFTLHTLHSHHVGQMRMMIARMEAFESLFMAKQVCRAPFDPPPHPSSYFPVLRVSMHG